jgi:uncharacterized oxidoreductase
MPTLAHDTLSAFVSRIFAAAGAPTETANLVARSLVDSDLAGHDSHGVVRVRQYLDSIGRGDLDPAVQPILVHDNGSVCIVDAQRSFGQLAARWTVEEAIARARRHNMAAAGIINCGHIGRLGEWVRMAADQGLIGMAFCNGGGVAGAVAPHGGAGRLLGTNPLAAAFPVGGRSPVVIDFATSAVAEGKVRVARNRGKAIPEGWILNAAGLPTTDPNDLYSGGMLLPAATHKGYALGLLVECLGGMLTGALGPGFPGYRPGNGVFFLVLNVAAFRPLADFEHDTGFLAGRVKTIAPAPGYDEVLLPGEPEERTYQARLEQGIAVDDATWTLLVEAAQHYQISVPTLA